MSDTEHAGRRDTRITIERLRGLTPADDGHIDETNADNWIVLTQWWAEVWTKGSREFYRADQVSALVTHKFKMKFDDALAVELMKPGAAKMRVRIGTRTINIDGPIADENEQHNYFVFGGVEVG